MSSSKKLNMDAETAQIDRMERGEPQVEAQLEAPSINSWRVLGKNFPRVEVVFFTQVFLIYIIVTACVVNLSLGRGDSNLWTCLLSSCLGYLLPNPKLNTTSTSSIFNRFKVDRKQNESNVPHPPQQ